MKSKATEQRYLLFGTKSETAEYQRWCKAHHQPVISAEKRQGKARIVMDLIWCGDNTFNKHALFLEKIWTIHDYVCSRSSGAGAGFYTEIDHVALPYAEFVAQAYLAIYRQTIGQPAMVPAFPVPEPDNLFVPRLTLAKVQRYFVDLAGNVGIPWRWKRFCHAYCWPYMYVGETRKESAKLEVQLPEGISFSSAIIEGIVRAGKDLGLKSVEERTKRNERWYLYNETGLSTGHAIPTATALAFAQAIVAMLPEQEFFPPPDEGWHE